MKRIIAITTTFFLIGNTYSVLALDDKLLKSPNDTIEVFFGDKGKIIIQVDSKEDLEVLKDYDINNMLKDIQISAEKSPDSVATVTIEDDSGEKYLKEEDAEFRQLEEEFEGSPDSESDHHGAAAVVPSTNADTEENQTAGYKHRYSGKKTRWISFMDFGMNNYLEEGGFPDANDAQYTIRPWGSWYVAIQPGWQTHITGKFALDYAVSVSWYNYKFQDASTWLIKGEEGVIFDSYAPEVKATKSKLTVVYLNAHLVPVFDFGYRTKRKIYADGTASKRTYYRGSKFRVGAGGYVGYRIDSYTKLVARPNGSKDKSREKDNFYLNNLRYGARFVLGVGEVDFFVNYDINTLFSEDRGPELNAFSFGLSF